MKQYPLSAGYKEEGTSKSAAELIDAGVKTIREQVFYVIINKGNYGATADEVAELLNSLTRTELKTLQLVSQKLSSKEIADLLFVSVKSVENYRSRICKKLNLDARNNSLLLWVLDNKKIIDGIK